jgi:hypothetical protein
MLALSDSRTISGSSAATVSPAETSTSMTGTSVKSPMSGTLTSLRVGFTMIGASVGVVDRAGRRTNPTGVRTYFLGFGWRSGEVSTAATGVPGS